MGIALQAKPRCNRAGMKPWRLFLLASHAILVALAVIFAAGTFAMAQAQSPVEHSKVIIDVVELEGTRLPKASQEELVSSLKQREWQEGSDWVVDVERIVIRALDSTRQFRWIACGCRLAV
jgi:hypothetical protein